MWRKRQEDAAAEQSGTNNERCRRSSFDFLFFALPLVPEGSDPGAASSNFVRQLAGARKFWQTTRL
jgi:hypothetical protein